MNDRRGRFVVATVITRRVAKNTRFSASDVCWAINVLPDIANDDLTLIGVLDDVYG